MASGVVRAWASMMSAIVCVLSGRTARMPISVRLMADIYVYSRATVSNNPMGLRTEIRTMGPMDNDTDAAAEVLDLRGLKCPLPALLAKRALLRVRPGTLVDVVADDPLAAVDIPHMCAQESFDVLWSRSDGEVVFLRLRRPTARASEPRSVPGGR